MNRDFTNLDELWGEGEMRVFISHKAEDKMLAKDIKNAFRVYGVASFVAHEDIKPMSEWQSEIERAVFSMDVLVALLTKKFNESDWTDQEVGVAIGRGVPVIPVRLGKDPYGFMGKFQAVQGATASKIVDRVIEYFRNQTQIDERLRQLAEQAVVSVTADYSNINRSSILTRASSEIESSSGGLGVLIRDAFANAHAEFDVEKIFESCIRSSETNDTLRELAKDAYISAVIDAQSFARANQLSRYLREIDSLTYPQAECLMRAFNENEQVRYAFAFAPIIAMELSRITGSSYVLEQPSELGSSLIKLPL